MIRQKLIITGGPKAIIRKFRQIANESMWECIVEWFREVAPKHFKRDAGPKYNYKRRSTGYQKHKDKHGLPPLVLTGNARRMLLTVIIQQRLQGTYVGMKGNMLAPNYFFMKGEGHPDMPAELTRMAPGERVEMCKRLGEKMAKKMNELKDREQITAGVKAGTLLLT